MIAESIEYVAERGIVRKEPIYSANRFSRMMSDLPASAVTQEHLIEFRRLATAAKLSPRTIESTIADLLTVILFVTKCRPDAGRKLQVRRPKPNPADIESISAVWPVCNIWLRQWLVIAYWTGLRLGDVISLQCNLSAKPPSSFTCDASKTGKHHVWPIPKWLQPWLKSVDLPYQRANCNARKRVRYALADACADTKQPVITPKQLRQRSVTEWSRANATAGSLIHGCGIGVLAHYIDPLSVLESAAPRVRLPSCFGADASQDAESGLITNFRRLDPAAQGLIAGTAERLAAG